MPEVSEETKALRPLLVSAVRDALPHNPITTQDASDIVDAVLRAMVVSGFYIQRVAPATVTQYLERDLDARTESDHPGGTLRGPGPSFEGGPSGTS